MTEEELILQDRLGVIRSVNEKYNLDENAYLSFSGGKDSTLLSALLDMAIPNNNIPRVFIDTGIEYNAIRAFVLDKADKDKRFHILKPTKPIKAVLEQYGYPFKSKQHSHNLMVYQHSGIGLSIKRYLGIIESNTLFRCPSNLMYQFTADFSLKCSDQCCLRLKKKPVKKWEKENNRHIAITGMRKAEGGERASLKGCVLTDESGNLKKFHPLLVVADEWEDWFVREYNIELCELYKEPFNFKRTGCKGCPFSLDLQEQLSTMELYMPAERKQCEIIWKPVYDEYRRIGYRLKKYEQIKIV